jgi:hypothetical protein
VLNAGDIIKVQAENADDLHVVLSYLSVTWLHQYLYLKIILKT